MRTLKLVKFRSLANEEELGFIKDIIKNNSFWCSKLWKLNDPMEGVFSTTNYESIKNIFSEKNNRVICSFSDIKALRNPLMWGYYANGFKGVAIEIEVNVDAYNHVITNSMITNDKVIRIKYGNESLFSENYLTVEEIVTRKLKKWSHEREYRFLKIGEEGLHEIGTLKKVYLGAPYYNVVNRDKIKEESELLQNYDELKEELKTFCDDSYDTLPLEDYFHR